MSLLFRKQEKRSDQPTLYEGLEGCWCDCKDYERFSMLYIPVLFKFQRKTSFRENGCLKSHLSFLLRFASQMPESELRKVCLIGTVFC